MSLIWETLYDEKDLEVYASKSKENTSVVISFDYSSVPGRPPHIPASNFFEDIGFDQIHIVTKRDAWYQTPEFLDIVDLILPIRRGYRRAVTYGNSMGAYGALLVSKAVEATDILAFAPQYTVDAAVMPEERRWLKATAELPFLYQPLETFIAPLARTFVMFDPFDDEDMRHIALLRSKTKFTEIRLPFAGHFPSTYLYENKALVEVMKYLLFTKEPVPAIARLRRTTRRSSSRYLVNLALWLAKRGKQAEALSCATKAYGLDPSKPEALEALLSITSRVTSLNVVSHICIRLLQKDHPGYDHYNAMRDEMLANLRRDHGVALIAS